MRQARTSRVPCAADATNTAITSPTPNSPWVASDESSWLSTTLKPVPKK